MIIKTTHAQLLAAILAGSTRNRALITDLYPILSVESPITGTVGVSYINDIPIIFEAPLMGGTVGLDEITLVRFGEIEYTETEENMTGTIAIDEITLSKILIEHTETEENMLGTVSIDEITLTEVLIPYIETEESMTGTIDIQEITLS